MFPDFTNLFTSHNLEKKNTHTGKGRRFDITFVLYTDGSTIDSHSFRPYYQTRQSLVRGVCVCVCVCVRERERERERERDSTDLTDTFWSDLGSMCP